MNKQRRLLILDIASKLEAIAVDIHGLLDAEQEYFDNMPESFQNGEKGEIANYAIDNLENALSYLGEVVSHLEEAAGQ